ncbi:RimK family alpha-L-glutamate ligase [Candidatus Woesearchaeota archaeon]|nr:RimK family alpha-L-glutamate ligase [Candidatus Woesearchaeota archaeon]
MKIDVVADELDREGKLLLEEIEKSGNEGEYVHANDISYFIKEEGIELYNKNEKYKIPDILIARSGFTREMGKSGRVFILTLENLGTKIIDNVNSILRAQEKTITAATLISKKIPYPYTINLKSKKLLKKIDFSPIVAKPEGGRRGQGVYKVDSTSEIEDFDSILLQEFIPSNGRDFRVFCVGDKCLGAISRTSQKKDEWRSNVALGGKPEVVKLKPEMKKLALKAKKAMGLDIAGVDLIENNSSYSVLEVNRSPQFGGFMEATGVNVAKEIIDFVLRQ